MISPLWRKTAPLDVLRKNMHLVRNLSLLDTNNKRCPQLWEALHQHGYIHRLEVHDEIFPVKRLIDPMGHTLSELKLSGNCTRMHPFLLIFVETQEHLRTLELTRFEFTGCNKPLLKKLVIGQQCEFLDHKVGPERGVAPEEDNDDTNEPVNKKMKLDLTAMDVDQKATAVSQVAAGTPANNGPQYGKNNDEAGAGDDSRKRKRKTRSLILSERLKNHQDFGHLPVEHLAIRDTRILLPFQKAILKVCKNVELDICYSQRADGNAIGTWSS